MDIRKIAQDAFINELEKIAQGFEFQNASASQAGYRPTPTAAPARSWMSKPVTNMAGVQNAMGRIGLGGASSASAFARPVRSMAGVQGAMRRSGLGGVASASIANRPQAAQPAVASRAPAAANPFEQANQRMGGGLNALVSMKGGYQRGSQGYANIQNKINEAYGVSRRHSVAPQTRMAVAPATTHTSVSVPAQTQASAARPSPSQMGATREQKMSQRSGGAWGAMRTPTQAQAPKQQTPAVPQGAVREQRMAQRAGGAWAARSKPTQMMASR